MQKRAFTFVLLAAFTIVLLVIGSTPAIAGTIDIPFMFTVGDDNVVGTLVLGNEVSNGIYVITSLMNATDNGDPISLLPPSSLW
jgi:hypothetical protein